MIPLPAGPRAPGLVQGIHLAYRPDRFFEECARRYGDCFTLRVPIGAPQVVFTSPAAVRDIFTADDEALCAGAANGILRPLLGAHSLLLLDGARHARERRLMLPPFHGERMLAYGHIMREVTDRVLERWPVGRPFPVQTEMQAITLDVILRTVFGVEGAALDRLRSLLRRLVSMVTNPLLLWPRLQVDLGPLSPWGRFVRVRDAVDRLLFAEMARRRNAESGERADVLSLLLEARDETGAPMRDEELRDEMMTLLLAGHETSATALSWTLHHVLGRPDVLAALRAELRAVVGDGPLAPEHVAQLRYLDATVKEALRLTPVVPDVGRLLTRPMRIDGRDLPAGVVAAVCIYLVHRRPDVWPEPERFDPTRFIDRRTSPYEFLPFGGGVRRCLGMAFALYEIKIVLAEVLMRVELQPAPGSRVRLVRRSITFAPSSGMPVVVTAHAA